MALPVVNRNTNTQSRRQQQTLDAFAIQRRAQAVELRRAGASPDVIAHRLSYDTIGECRDDLSAAYAEVLAIPTEESRALDVLRVDRLIMSIWGDARAGNGPSIDRVLKLIDMRAKLLGTYAPMQVEQVTYDAVEQEIRRLESELGAKDTTRGAGRPPAAPQRRTGPLKR